jgi:hypothetical protein
MKTRLFTMVTLVLPLATGMQLLAHDEFRIVGTVTAFQNSQLQVKNRDGKTFSIKVNTETYVHRDKVKERAPLAELKNGHSVVVDAIGDSEADLVAVEVRLVPDISPSR